jgi:tRNA wybutosine-synthesizing protein 2
MMRVRAVAKENLKDIASEDWIDYTRSPYADGNIVWVPVRDDRPCERVLPARTPYLGKGFFMLGDIAVIHGKKPAPAEVEEIVSFRHPRGVLWIDSLHEVTRTPKTEVLWGDGGEVRHRENGYTYILDPAKVMFAQGNRAEKMRMAKLVCHGTPAERVADMFAGIGYFTLPMAGNGAFVHAMEINPVAFDFLRRNLKENNLSGLVEASSGDCRNLLKGIYDRIVMGHFDAVSVLPAVLSHVGEGSVIHLHSVGIVQDAIKEEVERAGFSATITVHKVKKYRPHVWHVVQDVTIG